MAGVLYVVATPIGNLEDISRRALRVLAEVSLVAAEDTRRTRQLLTHFGIATKLVSFHAHNEADRVAPFLDRLRAGESIALVTDAGTPLVSDPGLALVREARRADIRVEAVPGASAVLTALACSGLPAEPFTFLGFPPVRSNDRTKWFADVERRRETVVFFEAPHRLGRTLRDLGAAVGERPVVVCRELTKRHEEVREGTAHALAEYFCHPRGEFTIVLGRRVEVVEVGVIPSASDIYSEFCEMTENSEARRPAIVALGRKYGLSGREIYGLIEQGKASLAEAPGDNGPGSEQLG